MHLALGGVMMNCGYDPNPANEYDLPPIAPQIWHAYHIAGEQLLIGVLAALIERRSSGLGQDVSCAIHEAVAKNTELDLMSWVMRRAPLYRLTCRHASETVTRVPSISHTKDGRWFMTWGVGARDRANLAPFLDRYGMAADLSVPEGSAATSARAIIPGTAAADEQSSHTLEVIQRFIRAYTYDKTPWSEAQAAGLLWAPVRKPHESVNDEHWLKRGAITEIFHPEAGRSFPYPTSKWLSSETRWQPGRRAPLIGEDTHEVLKPTNKARGAKPAVSKPASRPVGAVGPRPSICRCRMCASSIFPGFWPPPAARASPRRLGAESIKVEWKENPDTRLAAMAPVGGREARKSARAPLPGVTDSDMGGQYNNKNSGKRGISLNIRHPKGLEIARRLVAISDIVAEGFSPGVLDRLGLGYDVQRKIRPDIIYVQQSGMGGYGSYGRLRTVGPIAASFAGTNHMSGLPEPAMPAGWGYSYLDWMGAYGFAQALARRALLSLGDRQGQRIDASQCEAGIFLCGQPILEWAVNGREWERTGNRSPHGRAAPHGAYRCKGVDRWIAISCFDDEQWNALVRVAGADAWARGRPLRQSRGEGWQPGRSRQPCWAWTQNLDPTSAWSGSRRRAFRLAFARQPRIAATTTPNYKRSSGSPKLTEPRSAGGRSLKRPSNSAARPRILAASSIAARHAMRKTTNTCWANCSAIRPLTFAGSRPRASSEFLVLSHRSDILWITVLWQT